MGSKSRYVALLRGVNVGGKNKVPMRELVADLEVIGCSEVTSYIQSGNLVLTADKATAAKVPSSLSSAIKKRHGHEVPVVMRSASELRATLENNPFLAAGEDPDALFVLFLADRATAKAVAALDANRSPPDRFEVRGRDVYFLLKNGAARTKLTTAYFDRALATVSTARNWRTVAKLAAMSGG